MKKQIKWLLLLVLMMILVGNNVVIGQQPPPPPGGHGLNGNQGSGGSAPLGSGLVVLLAMGTAYGARKLTCARKKPNDKC